MTELRLNGRSADGGELELSDSEGNNFSLRISDSLRATVNQRRLSSVVDNDDESAPKSISVAELQARLRSGESIDKLSRLGNVSLEKIERFAGPILQERAYIIDIAQKTSLRRDSQPLSNLVARRLLPRGVDIDQLSWNVWRNSDGLWNVVLTYPTREGSATATWLFDSHRRVIASHDEGAKWIAGEETLTREQENKNDHGFLYPEEHREPPRLVSVRSDEPELAREPLRNVEPLIEPDARRDGVSKKISIPSWDDIMFGSKKKSTDSETPFESDDE